MEGGGGPDDSGGKTQPLSFSPPLQTSQQPLTHGDWEPSSNPDSSDKPQGGLGRWIPGTQGRVRNGSQGNRGQREPEKEEVEREEISK